MKEIVNDSSITPKCKEKVHFHLQENGPDASKTNSENMEKITKLSITERNATWEKLPPCTKNSNTNKIPPLVFKQKSDRTLYKNNQNFDLEDFDIETELDQKLKGLTLTENSNLPNETLTDVIDGIEVKEDRKSLSPIKGEIFSEKLSISDNLKSEFIHAKPQTSLIARGPDTSVLKEKLSAYRNEQPYSRTEQLHSSNYYSYKFPYFSPSYDDSDLKTYLQVRNQQLNEDNFFSATEDLDSVTPLQHSEEPLIGSEIFTLPTIKQTKENKIYHNVGNHYEPSVSLFNQINKTRASGYTFFVNSTNQQSNDINSFVVQSTRNYDLNSMTGSYFYKPSPNESTASSACCGEVFQNIGEQTLQTCIKSSIIPETDKANDFGIYISSNNPLFPCSYPKQANLGFAQPTQMISEHFQNKNTNISYRTLSCSPKPIPDHRSSSNFNPGFYRHQPNFSNVSEELFEQTPQKSDLFRNEIESNWISQTSPFNLASYKPQTNFSKGSEDLFEHTEQKSESSQNGTKPNWISQTSPFNSISYKHQTNFSNVFEDVFEQTQQKSDLPQNEIETNWISLNHVRSPDSGYGESPQIHSPSTPHTLDFISNMKYTENEFESFNSYSAPVEQCNVGVDNIEPSFHPEIREKRRTNKECINQSKINYEAFNNILNDDVLESLFRDSVSTEGVGYDFMPFIEYGSKLAQDSNFCRELNTSINKREIENKQSLISEQCLAMLPQVTEFSKNGQKEENSQKRLTTEDVHLKALKKQKRFLEFMKDILRLQKDDVDSKRIKSKEHSSRILTDAAKTQKQKSAIPIKNIAVTPEENENVVVPTAKYNKTGSKMQNSFQKVDNQITKSSTVSRRGRKPKPPKRPSVVRNLIFKHENVVSPFFLSALNEEKLKSDLICIYTQVLQNQTKVKNAVIYFLDDGVEENKKKTKNNQNRKKNTECNNKVASNSTKNVQNLTTSENNILHFLEGAEQKKNIEENEPYRRTNLHQAIIDKDFEKIYCIVEMHKELNGSSLFEINLLDSKGRTALDLAKQYGTQLLEEYLKGDMAKEVIKVDLPEVRQIKYQRKKPSCKGYNKK